MTREVVVINGWGMTAAAWQPLLARLPRGHAVQAMDLQALGTGAVAALAAAAAERAPRQCDVVGWSLGAKVALQWAHDCPSQVRRLVLIAATPCFVVRPEWPDAMAPAVFEAFEADVRRDAPAALKRFALLQSRGDANTTAVARVLRGAVCSGAPHEHAALHAGLDCLRSADLRALAPQVKQRTRLIHGRHDGLVPLAAAERLRDLLPASRLVVLPGAAHAPHVSEPAAVTAAIAEFLYEQ